MEKKRRKIYSVPHNTSKDIRISMELKYFVNFKSFSQINLLSKNASKQNNK